MLQSFKYHETHLWSLSVYAYVQPFPNSESVYNNTVVVYRIRVVSTPETQRKLKTQFSAVTGLDVAILSANAYAWFRKERVGVHGIPDRFF